MPEKYCVTVAKNRLECSLGTAQTSTNKTTIVLPASADLARTGLTPPRFTEAAAFGEKCVTVHRM